MKSRALQKTGVAACLFAMFCMLGGHWLALQSAAWAQMVIRFSETTSLGHAITKTFSGEYPCRMCEGIQEARQQEQQQEQKFPLLKREKAPDLFCTNRSVVAPLAPAQAQSAAPFVPQLHPDFISTPPTPPPRLS